MKHLIPYALLAALFLAALPMGAARKPKPVRVILDTDIGPDVDDVGAVAVLNALADRGEARLLAMGCCTSSEWGAPCLDALNTYYGRPDIPIGTFKGTGFLLDSKYNRQIVREFPNDLRSGRNAPEAAALYRQVLSRQPDHSVTFCATGPVNNLRLLLESGPDRFSSLDGTDLVARKVALLSVMGGRYPEGKEWNFEQDPAAAARVMERWPTPVLLSGFEIGARIFTGRRLHAEAPADSPVRAAYALFPGPDKDRESWDETAVLAAVRGAASHWSPSAGGTVTVDKTTGANRWNPASGGRHTYLIERDPPERVKDTIEGLMVRPPRRARSGSVPRSTEGRRVTEDGNPPPPGSGA
jgi:hypothetical protein